MIETEQQTTINTPEADKALQKEAQERQKIIDTFFSDGRLIQSPSKMSKRNIAYRIILDKFEPSKVYTEKEVNEIIRTVYDDYCEVRRHFVEFNWMTRANGLYQRVEE